ncbi:hypothetical protein K470DRAFT_298995 [Piedraia hortae CBS 480.64]|uniref:Cryptic loci regulator 2 N-terminal domain-containing protein n=1 Tax=Piedraia hortae CBS 480.64 TaxID=1314780 RepID=A0A6A7C2W5_9PEZI|nr:hypothetical protein K470DRAFT_298995 [Piedraia hortae CBS 480.64]
MTRFYPLYVRRSDAKLVYSTKGRRAERNGPTDDQLSQEPDAKGTCNFYREVGPDHVKSIDWRRKLGGMLIRELENKGNNFNPNYILAAFPENYRLFEHVKKTERDGKTEVKNKTHAGGGNDRQDAYLYGHPGGRKKRFRSPAEFFPHLLWLCTDESGDPDNCTCRVCTPEDIENSILAAKGHKTTPTATTQVALTTATRPAGNTPGPSAAPAQQVGPPTPLPAPRTSEQDIDRRPRSFMFRPGEVVWFARDNAWGLGIVLRRWNMVEGHENYTVQPLSFPGHRTPTVTKTTEHGLRPWLSWSVPLFTNAGLNAMTEPPRYESVDWAGIMQKRYGDGDTEIDASILAAKMIDGTFTPICEASVEHPEPGMEDRHYTGIFLGAEKIWVGDAVRLRFGSGTDIMVVHSVMERTRKTGTPQQPVIRRETFLIGDVYTLASVGQGAVPNNPQLPRRLTCDLTTRNARSQAVRGAASYWKLVTTRYRLDVADTRGRWYEATRLLPILNTAQYQEAVRRGDVGEASMMLNGRGDCVNVNRDSKPQLKSELVRRDTRELAIAGAAGSGEISEDSEPPVNVDDLFNMAA